MKFHWNLEQGTDEWFNIRLGKMTGSNAQAIQAQGKGLETYCLKKTAERLTGKRQESYSNPNMDMGNELELEAKELWALEHGVNYKNVGFVEVDDYVGCSPDGVMDDAIMEVKCHTDVVFTQLLLTGKIESKYKWQTIFNTVKCGKDRGVYIGYNPNFKNPFFELEIIPDQESIDKIEAGLEIGRKLISENCNKLLEQRKDITQ
jgi:hypothetical protein